MKRAYVQNVQHLQRKLHYVCFSWTHELSKHIFNLEDEDHIITDVIRVSSTRCRFHSRPASVGQRAKPRVCCCVCCVVVVCVCVCVLFRSSTLWLNKQSGRGWEGLGRRVGAPACGWRLAAVSPALCTGRPKPRPGNGPVQRLEAKCPTTERFSFQ